MDLISFDLNQDDIQMKGFIGRKKEIFVLEEESVIPDSYTTYIYPHYEFYFEYNQDRVYEIF